MKDFEFGLSLYYKFVFLFRFYFLVSQGNGRGPEQISTRLHGKNEFGEFFFFSNSMSNFLGLFFLVKTLAIFLILPVQMLICKIKRQQIEFTNHSILILITLFC